jgi:hypothetical protein
MTTIDQRIDEAVRNQDLAALQHIQEAVTKAAVDSAIEFHGRLLLSGLPFRLFPT